MRLLTEGFTFGAIKIVEDQGLNESERKLVKNRNGLFLSGICQMADTENGNKRIYPFSVLEREIEKYQSVISQSRAVGELDHPDSSEINLKNVSHKIVKMWWDGKNVMCKLVILDDPRIPLGSLAAGLVESKITLGISSRGMGSVREKRGGITLVEDDFTLICFDLVHEPSTPNAWQLPTQNNRFSESDQRELQRIMQYESKSSVESLIKEITKG